MLGGEDAPFSIFWVLFLFLFKQGLCMYIRLVLNSLGNEYWAGFLFPPVHSWRIVSHDSGHGDLKP